MKTFNMGLNTEPDWLKADEVIARFREKGNDEMVDYWEKQADKTKKLRDDIAEEVDANGEAGLNWECTGETRFNMHACQWAHAMPEYDFEIGRYKCIVRRKNGGNV